jgi:Zn-dependent alcohol dehydrogenase
MKMKAAILFDVNQDMSIEEVEIDAPKEGEVLLRIAYAGVCHSDLSVVRGRANSNLPIILGHEASAVVEAIGPGVNRVKPGDHVVFPGSLPAVIVTIVTRMLRLNVRPICRQR